MIAVFIFMILGGWLAGRPWPAWPTHQINLNSAGTSNEISVIRRIFLVIRRGALDKPRDAINAHRRRRLPIPGLGVARR
jgi:hypothetical protein